jgi:tetratricopeptide (TPR) repeat protein
VGGNLSEADSFLSKALALVAVDPPPPPVAGEVSGLVGSLLKDQRRLGEASDILSATVEQLRKDRDDQLAARLHMILAAVHKHSGKPFLAVEANAQALALLGPLAELRVLLWGWHNHAVYLRDADEWRAASEVFDTLSVLYDLLADRQTMLRRRWLEGLLLSSSSDSENAEAALREVLNGYAEDGAAFPAAMVGLDLSEQLLTEHRWTEVCEIADTLLKVFKTVGVHREATAALLLLAKSAARESLSRALILRLRDFLSRARVDRSLSLDQT